MTWNVAALRVGFWPEAHPSLPAPRPALHCKSYVLLHTHICTFCQHTLQRPPFWPRGTNTSSIVHSHPHKVGSREAAQAGPGSGPRALWTRNSRTPVTHGMAQKRRSGLQTARSLPCKRRVTGRGQAQSKGNLVPESKGSTGVIPCVY